MKKLNILFASIIIVLLIQCRKNEEFFELKRPEVTPISDVKSLELSVVDPYAGMFMTDALENPYAALIYRDFITSDISIDVANGFDYQHFRHYYRREFKNSPIAWDLYKGEHATHWAILYRALNQVVPALEMVEQAEEKKTDMFPNMTDFDRTENQRQKGELYFMRGFIHFTMARLFMPPYNDQGDNSGRYIPLKIKTETGAESARTPYLGTVQEFYDLIISDLKKAKDLLPEINRKGSGRANKYAASATLYRVYFYMGSTFHQQALDECNYIINDAVDSKAYYRLTEEPIVAWNRSYNATTETMPLPAKEVIWEVTNTRLDPEQGDQQAVFQRLAGVSAKRHYNITNDNWLAPADEWHHAALSRDVLQRIGWMDNTESVTPEAQSDLRYQQLYHLLRTPVGDIGVGGVYPDSVYDNFNNVIHNNIWINKYFRGIPDGKHSHFPLIRLAEIYLSRAMLNLSVNGNAGLAKLDVDIVRNRAGLLPLPANPTMRDLENERIKEMTGESGDRILYLIAYDLDINGNKVFETVLDNKIVSTEVLPGISVPYANFYWPVPYVESNFSFGVFE